MAVGTQEHALHDLLPSLRQRARQPATRQRERLLSRVDVVKLQRSRVSRVTAEPACAAGLAYEDLLDAPPTVAHRLDPAPLAPIAPRRRSHPRRPAVVPALAYDRGLSPGSRPSFRAHGLKIELRQPVTDGRRAHAEFPGDRTDRPACFDQRSQLGAVDPATVGVLWRVPGSQAVLVDPVRDGRRIAAGLAGDRLDRASCLELLCKSCRIHDANTSSIVGRNRRMRPTSVSGRGSSAATTQPHPERNRHVANQDH
jgi:hypothetical protein